MHQSRTVVHVGRPYNLDQFEVFAVRREWSLDHDFAMGQGVYTHLTPNGDWVEHQPFEVIEPALIVSGWLAAMLPGLDKGLSAELLRCGERDGVVAGSLEATLLAMAAAQQPAGTLQADSGDHLSEEL